MNRLEELEVIRLCLLEGQSKPTLLVLHQDSHEKRHLRTYTINIKDKTLDVGPWPSLPNVEQAAAFLIPVPAPLGGALLIGDEVPFHLFVSP
jgi:DNA damage-binding protein 1